jgi:hypothetical protein
MVEKKKRWEIVTERRQKWKKKKRGKKRKRKSEGKKGEKGEKTNYKNEKLTWDRRNFGSGHTFDRPLETMDLPVIASSLISLMLPHQRNQFLGRPALGLEVIVVRSRSTSIHLFHKSATSLPTFVWNIHSP